MSERRPLVLTGKALAAGIDDPTGLVGKLGSLGVGDSRVKVQGDFLGLESHLDFFFHRYGS